MKGLCSLLLPFEGVVEEVERLHARVEVEQSPALQDGQGERLQTS